MRVRGQARHGAGTIVPIILLLVVLAGCAAPGGSDPELTADAPKSKASQLVRIADSTRGGGDLGSALALYERAHQMRPDWSVPLLKRGETLATIGETEAAADAYRRAAEVAPDDLETQLEAGRALLRFDHPFDALDAFERAVALAPEDQRGYAGAGIALDFMGAHAAARERYAAGLERLPDALGLQSNLGISLALAGDTAAAIQQLRRATQHPAAGPGTWENLALALALDGRMDEAREMVNAHLGRDAAANDLKWFEELRRLDGAARARAVFRREMPPPDGASTPTS